MPPSGVSISKTVSVSGSNCLLQPLVQSSAESHSLVLVATVAILQYIC